MPGKFQLGLNEHFIRAINISVSSEDPNRPLENALTGSRSTFWETAVEVNDSEIIVNAGSLNDRPVNYFAMSGADRMIGSDLLSQRLRIEVRGSNDNYVNEDVLIHTEDFTESSFCLLYTSPSPRDQRGSRMPSSA